MRNTVQQLYDDNITLKKSLQTSRMHIQKLQRQNNQLKQVYQQSQKRLSILRGQYMQLQKKHQFALSESTKTVNSFSSQIQQLKNLVQDKQRQIQNIQLKMIPNIDQDMIRVKLITEMEGPYQQMIDKKERDIQKLKDKLSDMQRKNTLLELNLNNKTRQYEKQVQSIRSFYETQNESLMKQVTHFMTKNQIKTIDKDLVKSQRKQLDQLRYLLQFKTKQIQDLHTQIGQIKCQRDKLLAQIAQMRSRNVIQMQKLSINNPQALKSQNNRLNTQLEVKREELERCQKRFRQLQSQFRKLQSNYGRQINSLKQKHLQEKQSLKNQIRQIKGQYDRSQNSKSYQQHEYQQYSEKIRVLEKQNRQLKKQSQHLREQVIKLESHSKQIHKFHQKQIHIFERQKQRQRERQKLIQKQHERENTNIINNQIKQPTNDNSQQIDTLKKKNQELQVKVSKLLKKLEYANRKIIQLIKEKAVSRSPNRKKGYSFHDTRQSPQRELIELQFQDAGFIPLCPPAYYHQYRRQ